MFSDYIAFSNPSCGDPVSRPSPPPRPKRKGNSLNFVRRLRTVIRFGCPVVVALTLCGGAVHGQSSDAATVIASPAYDSPFVAGFDRFGRHGEISPQHAGALLVSELNCTACHASDDPWLAPKGGPRLTGAGLRLRPEWIREYLRAPHVAKPGTTMPDVLAGLPEDRRESAIEALVAFLGTQRETFPELKAGGASPVVHEFWRRGDAERGAKLYHTVGCVACHAADPDYETLESKPSAIDALLEQLDPEEIADLGLASEARGVNSIPHSDLERKYSLRSLTMMLLDPTRTRPNARMPSLRLSPGEAADLAAYLLQGTSEVPVEIVAGDPVESLVAEGRKLFQELRCASCHAAGGVEQSESATPWKSLRIDDRPNCLSDPVEAMTHYPLDDLQREMIREQLVESEATGRSVSDQVHYRMLQLNCYGCHRRDELGGVGRFRKPYLETVGNVDLGDEGRLPPTLTGVGGKLVSKALAAVFHPRTSPHRPYMTVRMPTYAHATVGSILDGLPKADRVDLAKAREVFTPLDGLTEAGRELANTGCVGCHAFRGETLPGVVGIDLSGITRRVRPKWFYDFVLNPSSVKERTRMPTFFPDGKSNRKDLLGGDVDRQISALWAYLENLDKEPLPAKIEEVRSANYELSPAEKPVILRTFMQAAGTHAIAVGFPAGTHYAFDAEQVRPAIAWKDRFLDARGTWFERFAPPADPLGQQVIRFPEAGVLGGESDASPSFRGYRLDQAGVPTLLYQIGGVSVEDRIEAVAGGGLTRTVRLQVAEPADRIVMRAHSGKELSVLDAGSCRDDQGLTVTIPPELADKAERSESGGNVEWLVPLRVEDTETVVLEYRW
jgi:mono/diheme cytochrome c family protein